MVSMEGCQAIRGNDVISRGQDLFTFEVVTLVDQKACEICPYAIVYIYEIFINEIINKKNIRRE